MAEKNGNGELKALSRHMSATRDANVEIAEEVSVQTVYLRWGSYAAIGLFVLALLAVLNATRVVAMPIVMGVVVGLILSPAADYGERFRIPGAATALAIVAGLIALVGGAVYVMMPSLPEVTAILPRISHGFQNILKSVEGLLTMFEGLRKTAVESGAVAGRMTIVAETRASTVDLATRAMEIVTPTISQFVIFLFTLLMYIATRKDIRQAAVLMVEGRERRLSVLRSFNEAQAKLAEYIFTVAAINAALGVVVAAVFWAFGVPGALLWGFLAFALNFMPVVGPLILKALLIVFGIATYPNLLHAMTPFGLFLTISLIEANLVTPKIVGDRITMNPMLVFLSVVVWTWLWGFAGAFLAMPLLALASVIREEYLEEEAPRLPT